MAARNRRVFGATSTAAEVIAGHDLSGADVIVTGGASGIGEVAARTFAGAGARVLVAGRDEVAGIAARDRIREATANDDVHFDLLDLASLASVNAFAERFLAARRPLHRLINNAAVRATAELRRTADGFELQFGTNHLGHFALTEALLPALRAAAPARVVVLSSRAHRYSDIDFDDPNYERRAYDPWEAYGQSKTANALFAVEFTARYAGAGLTANSLMPGGATTGPQRHSPNPRQREPGRPDDAGRATPMPGGVITGPQCHVPDPRQREPGRPDDAGRATPPPGRKTPEQGAATTVWAAVSPDLDGIGGRCLDQCAVAEPWTGTGAMPSGYCMPYALDPERARRLWELSLQLVTP
ncbi:SDR family NAD(P)-dependent oxidoreductase [Streptomyces sp. VRA16 Mangrove soil]|uniref:SDR family NAD(P)-dependent oxidoreductase n=1 Tax=Streptomyces sp. VRA16 Mangrove soil TaxID=2817434 RepID=UPI001A9DFD64|nr:SDR family NAD(P)-dependent oxidoreductase [Streptomyces sp. VRA16 Mangrove soil]MBO1336146.1 SDR family NAD(P)-dependent oxidoreductase [Streptomyces sp. VRA16 Mangrove soil]